MLYVEYETAKTKYNRAREVYDSLIGEKEELFQITQIHGMDYEVERVDGGIQKSKFDTYMLKKEQVKIDERIAEAEDILKRRKEQLRTTENELVASSDISDKIYILKYLGNSTKSQIAEKTGYSTSQVYRILEKIEKEIRNL